MVLLWAGLSIVFNTFPRPAYSELEKRPLKTVPPFTLDSLRSGAYTSEVSSWYSDSEPYRDFFMTLSMAFDHLLSLPGSGEGRVRFHAPKDHSTSGEEDSAAFAALIAREDSLANLPREYSPYAPGDTSMSIGNADDKAKVVNSGIIIVGSGENVRALMGFWATEKNGGNYALTVNRYDAVFGDSVRVYCMPIPTSTEFYCPPSAKKSVKEQWPVMNNIFVHLSPRVGVVNIHPVLSEHRGEPIYLRTDHHWAPLGAFYAAREFARQAGVPFRDLDAYEEHVVHRFVGSMYGYSGDISVKKAPEDFVYYVPREVEYTTTYVNYSANADLQVTGESRPYEGSFFFHYPDGSGGAYSTFMGGDMKLTKVSTGTRNGRRVLILKDSFGNAVPGYLFYSFEEVHVADFRYFTKNLVKYVGENRITDILFANNIGNCCSAFVCRSYIRFLTQKGGIVVPDVPRDSTYRDDVMSRQTVDSVERSALLPRDSVRAAGDSLAAAVRDSVIGKVLDTAGRKPSVPDTLAVPPMPLDSTVVKAKEEPEREVKDTSDVSSGKRKEVVEVTAGKEEGEEEAGKSYGI